MMIPTTAARGDDIGANASSPTNIEHRGDGRGGTNAGGKQQRRSKPKKNFLPYRKTTLDTPLFHFIVEPILPLLRPILSCIYSIRWELSRPLQTKVFPRWMMAVTSPSESGGRGPQILHNLSLLTYGQLLLAVPFIILLLASYYATFVSPNIDLSGSIAGFALYMVFLTQNKTNSIFTFLFGISFERMIIYHKLSSILAVVLSFLHGYVAYAYGDSASGDSSAGIGFSVIGSGGGDSSDDRRHLSEDSQYGFSGSNPNLIKFALDGGTNTSGTLLALSMTLLVVTSWFPILRRKFFDAWFWLHIALAICTIIFCMMHEVTLIIAVAFWWSVDVLLRYMVMAGCRYPGKATLSVVYDDVVEVKFRKPQGFDYNPGQFVQISFPDIGILSFHPISISSAPQEEYVTLHIRALGDWSNKLLNLAKKKMKENLETQAETEVSILVEGPYGCLSVDIDDHRRYQMVLCVSGGIGVTHCQSVTKSVFHDHVKNGRSLKQVRFVWCVRDADMLKLLSPWEVPQGRPRDSRGSNDFDIELTTQSLAVTEEFHGSSSSNMMITPSSPPKNDNGGLVKTDIFVTKSTSANSSNNNVETGMSSSSWNIHHGRPNIDAILEEVKHDARTLGGSRGGITHVAVFVCGPKPLVNKVQNACRLQSQTVLEMGTRGGVIFNVHEEIFDF